MIFKTMSYNHTLTGTWVLCMSCGLHSFWLNVLVDVLEKTCILDVWEGLDSMETGCLNDLLGPIAVFWGLMSELTCLILNLRSWVFWS